MFCDLGEEERTKIWKKKREKKGNKRKKKEKKRKKKEKKKRKEKKEINLIAALQPYEIFFATLKPVLTETAFYAKLAGWFSGFKTKVM